MANFLDALARAVQDAMEGYQRYQTQIRPGLEERSAAAEARKRQLAGADLSIARQIYGTDEAIAEALGEEAYTNLVKGATGGRVAPAFRDVPITETVRGRRQAGVRTVRRPMPFEDVEPAQPLRIEDRPAPITGTGPGLLRAGLPMPRVLEAPEPVAPTQEVEEPVFEEFEEEKPTGKIRRELVLPGRVAEPMINIPSLGIRMRLSQARETFGPEGMRWLAGIVNPTEATRLELDIKKAEFDQAHKIAQLKWDQIKHVNPSAYEQAKLQLDALKDASAAADRAATRALQTGQLSELKRWHDVQGRLQKEANEIRRAAVRARAARAKTSELRFTDLKGYYATLVKQISDLRDEVPSEEIDEQILEKQQEARRIQKMLQERTGGQLVVPPAGQGKHRGGQRVVYKTIASGALNAQQIEAAIANMQRRGLTPAQITKELRDDGIPPEDFGY